MFVVFYYLCIDAMVNKQINQLVADSSVKNNARKPQSVSETALSWQGFWSYPMDVLHGQFELKRG